MNPELTQQTEQLLKAFNTLHQDLAALYLTMCIIGAVTVACLLIIAFRRR
jgi:hypothetical protein